MASAVKWIKLTTDMFEDDKIDMILKMPDGDSLIVIWVRLLTMAGKSNAKGYILLTEDVPYDAAMLSSKCGKSMQVVNYALSTFEKFKMIEVDEKGILVKNFNRHQDLENLNHKRELNKLRKQKEREAKKMQLQTQQENMSRVTVRDNMRDVTRDVSYSYSYNNNNNIIYNNSKNCAKNDDYINFFNQNFHLITPHELDVLKSFVEDGLDDSVITMALTIAVESNVREIKYVKKILTTWLENGLDSIEKVQAYNLEFERNKQSKNKSGEPIRYDQFDFKGDLM